MPLSLLNDPAVSAPLDCPSLVGQPLLLVTLNTERRRAWLDGFLQLGAKVESPVPSLAVDVLLFCFSLQTIFKVVVVDTEGLANAHALVVLLKELFPQCFLVLIGSDSQPVSSASYLPSNTSFSKLVQKIASVYFPPSPSRPSFVSPAEGAALRRRAFEYFSEMLDPDSAHELMSSSLASVATALHKIEKSREGGHREELARAVHGLKGILLNSGLREEGATAASIEHVLRQPDEDWQEAPLDSLLMKLSSYITQP